MKRIGKSHIFYCIIPYEVDIPGMPNYHWGICIKYRGEYYNIGGGGARTLHQAKKACIKASKAY